jgi:hypothetical protein
VTTSTLPLLAAQELHAPFGAEEPRISDGGGLTLGHLVDSVWEGLHAAGAAGCLVCGGRMERHGAQGGCTGCGSTLS